MSDPRTPLYVRLGTEHARRLDAAVTASGKTKRQLIEDAVRAHLGYDGLVVGRVALREPLPEVLTASEAAELLRLEEPQVVAAAEQGEIPGRRIAGEWRFSKAALLESLAPARSAR